MNGSLHLNVTFEQTGQCSCHLNRCIVPIVISILEWTSMVFNCTFLKKIIG